MTIKLTVNGTTTTTINIDQTGSNTIITIDPSQPSGGCRAEPIPDGIGYYTGPVATDIAPSEPTGHRFNPEQLGKLREVIRALSYGIMDLGPSDGSTSDRVRRDNKLKEKFHLEKDALGCLCRLVGDDFYDKILKDFNI